ncbi:Stk1 family PASTA domain-containing Ser/Thr kinase [Saxibacter everestensis]|uniref:non-specific serine/threonine protein kinase n=1 Tax=Saxibacter everestensis TaxID=2909229 RepID=A0ABY8QRY1_9MICO|nr:Stk1 family PASTA domain-containing Ser/Thr kinase [Brevibacteriaceae bacterium ZFBP1038]
MNDRRVLAGRYEIRSILGRGGMAEVHEGLDTRLGRTVAIKLLRSDLARDPSFQARLRREAQSAAALNHPTIVAVYDSGEEVVHEAGGEDIHVPFIVMEYVKGKTLREIIKREGGATIREALDISAGVLSALQYSHRAGIVHRDIKPANVMLTPNGDVKVMDFGIARALADSGATMTQTQAVVGTAQYLSPEQARGELVDARSDLYSAGCLMYELLTGQPPFTGDSPVSVAYQHVREVPEPPSSINPAINEALDAVVMHALKKERDERYQDAAQFRDDVLAARDGRPLSLSGPDDDATVAMGAAGLVGGAAGAAAAAGAAGATQAFPQQPTAVYPMQTANGANGTAESDPAETTFDRMMLGEAGANPGDDEPPVEEKKKKTRKTGMIVLACVLIAALLGALGYWLVALSTAEPEPVTFKLDNMVNVPASQAEQILEGRSLKVVQKERNDDEVVEGNVAATDPEAGTTVAEGSTVTLFVSTGPESIEVPDVNGQTETYARQLIAQAGLTAGKNNEDFSPDVDKGNVIRTDPKKGSKVDPDEQVDLVLSNGQIEVPNVTGEGSKSDACKILESDDYQLKCKTKDVEDEKAEEGSVIGQSTEGGEAVDQHTTITIEIAVKPEPEPSPSEPEPTQTETPTIPVPTLPVPPED